MITPFSFKETEIKGLIEVTPFNADDVRGCFTKDYSKEIFAANGIDYNLVEVFYTKSLIPNFSKCIICKKLVASSFCPASKAILAQVRASCRAL